MLEELKNKVFCFSKKILEALKDNYKNYFSFESKVIFIAALVLLCATISISAARKTVIISLDGNEKKVTTFKKDFKGVLKDNGIILAEKDKATPSIDSKLKAKDRIDIKKAVDIDLAVDDKQLKIQSAEDNVEKMLEAEGIALEQFDTVVPSKEVAISNGLKVEVTRVKPAIIRETVPIDFSTIVKKDDGMEKGTSRIVQLGELGEKVISTKVVFENGKEVSRNIVSEVMSKLPIEQVMAVGTLGVVPVSRGGNKTYYTNSMQVKATAYTAGYASTGKHPGDPGYEITSTGTRAKRQIDGFSTIAVDPRVIPYGTKLYVDGYGYAIAEDCGGAIKGNIIDVYFNSEYEARMWGVKWINIYLLKWRDGSSNAPISFMMEKIKKENKEQRIKNKE